MNAIEIKGLTKRYREVVAVDNLSLTVAQGELPARDTPPPSTRFPA